MVGTKTDWLVLGRGVDVVLLLQYDVCGLLGGDVVFLWKSGRYYLLYLAEESACPCLRGEARLS